MKKKSIWKQWPNREPIRKAMSRDRSIWNIYWWVNGSVCARTVKETAKQFDMSTEKARRRLEALYKFGYLSKKRQSFWNGMHYADKDFYW